MNVVAGEVVVTSDDGKLLVDVCESCARQCDWLDMELVGGQTVVTGVMQDGGGCWRGEE